VQDHRRCADIWHQSGLVFGSKDVHQGKGTLKVGDARDVTDVARAFSIEEDSGQWTKLIVKRVVQKVSVGPTNYPTLTKPTTTNGQC
jgi:hypothetical protein